MDKIDDNKLTNHDYDGIQEYDNPLPNWWLMIFCGTIIFGFIYYIHYNVGGGQTQLQELAADLETLPKDVDKTWNEDDLKGKIDGPEFLKAGQAIFAGKCSSCHGQEGQGVIGPNLTDNFWINGKGERKDIIHTVNKGVLEKGMPAWEGILSDEEELAVTGYVYSLRTTKPANPKAPQGMEY